VIQTRQHGCLAQKLLAGFAHHFRGKRAVMFHFLQGALATFQPLVIGKVDAAHPTLPDHPADAVSAAQYIPGF